ncbi:serine protease 56 [Zootoca vivipara]|uniref:serine protease 56 n=1 Tax=Zootoca vivipara TaxID=8524 RepID=UPI00293BF6FE|nr:serine protease 56 [Zootoca vivipara]
MKSALLSLEGSLLEHARRLQECEECVLCLFGNCGNWTRECVPSELPLGSLPSCEAVLQAQAIPEQPAQNWALSKACAPYRRLCSGQEMSTDSCIHLMVSHCQLRLQECRLESDMDYLNTVADQSDPASAPQGSGGPMHQHLFSNASCKGKGLCGHRGVPAPNTTMAKAKIVGGSKAWPGAWPWLVSVRLNGELMCGGVLVGDAWVLTAAHCFTGSRNELAWSVVLGDYDLTKLDEGEQVVAVSRILSYPKFNPKTFHNDVALLELSSPVTPSAWVTPVCLPERPMELGTGMPCYIIGWGSLYEDGPGADVVMEAQVPILAQDICRGALGRQLFTSAMFCAGFLSGGIDSCQGDSGGPLTCWDPLSERYVLYGITSWGDGCGERGKPGVYTRVAAFTDWVHQQMEKSPSSREPTCFELLALAQMPPDRQRAELGHLCAFYTQPCSPSAGPAACAHAADEKCKAKRQQCELRSYAQTLLEFLRRAEEFFRTQIDFSFFTHSLPQFMEQVYHHLFPPRARQDSRGTPWPMSWDEDRINIRDLVAQISLVAESGAVVATGGGRESLQPDARKMQKREAQTTSPRRPPRSTLPSFASLFQGTGPSLGDWVQELNALAEGSRTTAGEEEHLFLQQADGEVKELQEQGRIFLQQLRRELGLQDAFPEAGTEEEATSAATTTPQGLALNDSLASEAHPQREKRSLGNAGPIWGKDDTFPQVPAAGSSCRGVNESAQQVRSVHEMHRWILQVPERDLAMTFQEILVDLGSKNSKGLYRARIQATVGHRSTSFTGLIGLASDSLYRSMPGLIALALESLKT